MSDLQIPRICIPIPGTSTVLRVLDLDTDPLMKLYWELRYRILYKHVGLTMDDIKTNEDMSRSSSVLYFALMLLDNDNDTQQTTTTPAGSIDGQEICKLDDTINTTTSSSCDTSHITTTGRMIACARTDRVGDKGAWQIRCVAVDDQYQGKGYGKIFMRQVEAYLCLNYHTPLILLNARETALQFYSNLGWIMKEKAFIWHNIQHYYMEKEYIYPQVTLLPSPESIYTTDRTDEVTQKFYSPSSKPSDPSGPSSPLSASSQQPIIVPSSIVVRSPLTPAEWDDYYQLRWKLLREQWNQPHGTEKTKEDYRLKSTIYTLPSLDDVLSTPCIPQKEAIVKEEDWIPETLHYALYDRGILKAVVRTDSTMCAISDYGSSSVSSIKLKEGQEPQPPPQPNSIWQIRCVAVDSTEQGKGYGKILFQYVENDLRQRYTVQTIMFHAREKAVPFYKRFGYDILYKSHLVYDDVQHWYMEKHFKI